MSRARAWLGLRVCTYLASALACSACAKTTAQWIADLQDVDPFARQLAAIALGSTARYDAEAAVRALAQHLDESDPKVFAALLSSLDKMADDALPALIEAIEPEHILIAQRKQELEQLLARKREQFLPHLLDLLRTPEGCDPRRVVSLLRPLRADELPQLLELLDDPKPRVRRVAVWMLGVLVEDGGRLASVLEHPLADSDPSVRRSAAETLCRAAGDDEQILTVLRRVVRDPDPLVRSAALGPSIHAAATRLLDPDEEQRSWSLVLFEHLDSSDLDALIEGLESAQPTCARRALQALSDLRREPVRRDPATVAGGPRLQSTQPLCAPGESLTVEALVERLGAPEVARRARAAWWIGNLDERDPRTITALLSALDDQRACVRTCAAASLLCLDRWNDDALARIERLCSDENSLVRRLAEQMRERLSAR